MNKEKIGRRIKSIRRGQGLTMVLFSEKIDGVKSGVISNWENGKQVPNKERLKKIAEIGNVTVPYLLYGEIREVITDMTDEFFVRKARLSLLDRQEIIDENDQKYLTERATFFYRKFSEDNPENIDRLMTWGEKNEYDSEFYSYMINDFERELNQIYALYEGEFATMPAKFKKISAILQENFIDAKSVEDFIIKIFNEIKDEKLSSGYKEALYLDTLEFFTRLFHGCFQHYEYHRKPKIYDAIGSAIISGSVNITYNIDLASFANWHKLTDNRKEKLHAQLTNMSEMMINHELNDQKMTEANIKED
ncbi:helix-turn-helix domain-containing protein [Macrococcus bovicus]|uniref:XRE family transcriptional regulator n=1 Tax=Macrococcus bovicus TaxID=69968 RepID=A0A4R6C368_9STAP|nr:helix-turn-helix transcriptional regulator [Macrococcus bovicus]TDM15621.1 XRE family transcriptional regulator [Macrococcus bovicus]